jgi:competence protein ComEC
MPHGSTPRALTWCLITAVGCGFGGAGGVLGASDAARARHPSLVAELATLDLDPTTCGGQPPARLHHSCDIIVDLEGTLQNDAAPGEFGVTFTLDADRVHVAGGHANARRTEMRNATADANPPAALTAARSIAARSLAGALRRGDQLTGDGDHSSDRVTGVVDSDARAVTGAVRVTVGGQSAFARMAEWRAGRRIRAPVSLRAPLPYRNVGVPDQRDRLALAGISLFGSIKSATLVEIVARGSPWQERAADLRAWARRAITKHVRTGSAARPPPSASPGPAQSAAIVIAVLIGDRAGLSPDVERRLQRAGTYHVIAISGGNIAILTGLLLAVLRFLPIPPSVRVCLAAVLVLLYALVIDEGPSVVRATMAAVVYLVARAIDVEARSLEILAAVVFLMLLAAPLDIVDAGFWLTCGATLGILLHAGPALHRLRAAWPRVRPPIVWAVASLVITTFFAELVLLPITAFTFSQITLAGLLVNIAAIPLMTVVQVAGMTMLAVEASETMADVAGWIAHVAATGLVRSADLVELAPWMALRVAPPPMWLLFAYFAAWAGLWIAPVAYRLLPASARRARLQLAMALAWTSCLALIVCAPPLPTLSLPPGAAAGAAECEPLPIPPAWRDRAWMLLTMIDVGQGGAAVVQADDGRALLVDAGGTMSPAFDMGGRVVSPALWALGIRRLDALALTHGDIDHIGGAPAIVHDFTPREFWSADSPAGGPASEPARDDRLLAVAAKARANGARVRTLAAGDRVQLGHASIRVWNPPAAAPGGWLAPAPAVAPPRGRLRNDESLVLDLRLGDVSFILPGDISTDVERRLAWGAGEPSTPLASLRVLAAPHHGSQTSSSAVFLDALTPRVVLISAGLNNRHGHPSLATLDRYRARGISIFRTDLDGAIQVVTDGAAIRIATCSGRRATFDLAAARSP